MITIVNAYTQRGWSNCDWKIDDSRIVGMIGRSYKSVTVAMRTASKLADDLGYAAIEYVVNETGDRWLRGAEPPLPGRQPLCRRVE